MNNEVKLSLVLQRDTENLKVQSSSLWEPQWDRKQVSQRRWKKNMKKNNENLHDSYFLTISFTYLKKIILMQSWDRLKREPDYLTMIKALLYIFKMW